MEARAVVVQWFSNLSPAVQVLVPLALVVAAPWLDLRTRRGFGLGLLALLTIPLLIYVPWYFATLPDAHNGELSGFGVVVGWMLLAPWVLAVVIAALVVAIRARDRRWALALIVVTVLSPVVGFPAAFSVRPVPTGVVLLWGILVVPMLAVLAYSATRIVRPVAHVQVPQPTR